MSKPSFWRTAAVVAAAVLLVAGCSSAATPAKPSAASAGGVVTFAEAPGSSPNYIFPLMPSLTPADWPQFSQLLYLPLYWFGENGKPVFNESLSIGKPPIFSDNNTLVTVTLKHWLWSDGKPITARDIVLWMNMLSAVTDPSSPVIGSSTAPGPAWSDTVPGGFPQNVVSYDQTGTYTIVFRLNASYNPTWYLDNELSQVFPVPQMAWDELSGGGPIGSADATAEVRTALPSTSPTAYVPSNPGTGTTGALGVAQFLNSQAQSLSTYDTNPLWKVVDGPFELSQFTTSGFVKMVPNPDYSGSPKPKISAFELLPFTTDAAEFNALLSGSLTIGYIPTQDLLTQKASLEKRGYSFSPWYVFGTNYFQYNFTNATAGPVFSQLYFRQAFQSLVNQPQYIKSFAVGIGHINNGPVPSYPKGSPDESSLEAKGQVYPYDPAKAVSLLKDNGWTVVPGGTSYCSRPGTAPGDCGAGVKSNQKATFSVLYASGETELTDEMEALQSTLKEKVGIGLTLSSAPFSDVISTAFAGCTFSTPCNNWEFINWGGGQSYSPDYFPTGDGVFNAGGEVNVGYYSNPTNDTNIHLTETASTGTAELKDMVRYQNYLARQLPVVWMPNLPFQFTMYKSNLKGLIPQGIFLEIYPQYYGFTN